MKPFLIICALALSLLISCNSKEKKAKTSNDSKTEIIPSSKMRTLMIDVFLAESAIMSKQLQYRDVDYYTIKYYNYVFVNNDVNAAQFSKSINYYSSNSDEFTKIMNDVVDSLSALQSSVSNK